MSWGNHHRKFRGMSAAALAAGAAGATHSARICGALRERYADLKHAPKRLALLAGAKPRTAENWLVGECGPSVDHLVELMAADPAMEAVVLDVVRVRRAARGGG